MKCLFEDLGSLLESFLHRAVLRAAHSLDFYDESERGLFGDSLRKVVRVTLFPFSFSVGAFLIISAFLF